MKHLFILVNAYFYCLYKIDYSIRLGLNNINPIMYLHNLPSVKKKFAAKNIDSKLMIKNIYINKQYGLSVNSAGAGLYFTAFLCLDTFFKLLIQNFHFNFIYYFVIGILTAMVNYFFVFRNDKYLEYFSEFENWSRERKI